jgi:hypothetical protein
MIMTCPIKIFKKGVRILIDAVICNNTKPKAIDGINIGDVNNEINKPFCLKLYLVTLIEANTPITISNKVATIATFTLLRKPSTNFEFSANIFAYHFMDKPCGGNVMISVALKDTITMTIIGANIIINEITVINLNNQFIFFFSGMIYTPPTFFDT